MRPFFLAKNLPRHDVGVVLHGGDEHFISSADMDAAIGLRDEVDGLSCAADENNLARVGCVDELLERVHTAMNVGVQVIVIVCDGVENYLRLLRCGAVVKINQRLAVDSLGKDGEVSADFCDIETRGGLRRSCARKRVMNDRLGDCCHPNPSQFCVSSSGCATSSGATGTAA